MKKGRTNPKVDGYLNRIKQWRPETEQLRTILLGCGLTEELKWGKPGYTFEGKNVVVIQGFKAYCALLFFKGVLLKNAHGLLVKTGENARVGRQIRFTQVQEIIKQKSNLKACIQEAIEVEKAGLKVVLEKSTEPAIPEELEKKLSQSPALKTAFTALTPGRQRAYIFYFSAPKQSKTREARIEKYRAQILKGIGLYDKYLSAKK